MEASRALPQPLRIDVATSQIEGGQAIGWVDPDRVTGCVAYSEPREAFERFALPHLTDALPEDEQESALPLGITMLIAGLKAAHLRLYRENHSLMKEPKWVRVTAACAEENRIYFVKTQASWIYLLRAGRAYLVGGEESLRQVDTREEALGGPEKLRLQVTSIEVTQDDQVLLVAGDAQEPPDLRAISRLFSESRDLKRACDGLVNLLGLQGPSASVVAFRFTPLLSGTQHPYLDTSRGEEVLGEIADMAREFVLAAQESPEEFAEAAAGEDEHEPPVLEPPAPEPPAAESPAAARDAGEPEAYSASGRAESPAPIAALRADEGQGLVEAMPPAKDPQPPEQPAPPVTRERPAQEATRRAPGGRMRSSALPVVLVALILLITALVLLSGAGWPGLLDRARDWFEGLRGNATVTQTYGLVTLSSQPEGAIVAVDGHKLPGRTPLRGVRLPRGPHEVAFYLGAAGVWVDSLEVTAGRTDSLHATFIGSLEIAAVDTSGTPRAWLEGQTEKRALPAVFADLPAGWYRVFFEDERIPLWERKILVRSGEPTHLQVNNAFKDSEVLLRVESLHMIPTEGLKTMPEDSVFVDGAFVGFAPVEMTVEPGLHGVRVTAGEESHCEVLRLPAGASRFVTPQFGLRPRPSFHHRPPGRVALQGPVLLAVEIQHEEGGLRQPRLELPDGAGGPQSLPLVQVDSGEHLYVGKIPPQGLILGEPVAYYFAVLTPAGDEAVSDLYRFTPIGDAAALEEAAAEQAAVVGAR